jgi:tetratricopeptide (TPR) repeat protein
MDLVDRIRDHESVVAFSKAYAYWGFGLYQAATGQVQAAIDSFEAASLVVRQTDTFIPISPHWLAWAYTQGGRASDALALLLNAEKEMARSSSGLFPFRVHHYMALAETHLALGAVAEARTAIGRAQKIAEHTASLPTWLRSFGVGVASKRPIVHPICALPEPFINARSNSPVPEVCARWLLNVWLAWRRLGMSKVMLLRPQTIKHRPNSSSMS